LKVKFPIAVSANLNSFIYTKANYLLAIIVIEKRMPLQSYFCKSLIL